MQEHIKKNSGEKILFIFEDTILHHLKEQTIYDLANQPFAPTNILHELMENTGIFKNYEMTTLVSFDSDSSSMMFKKDEMDLEKNLDSISDQIMIFSSEQSKLTKPFMPQIGLNFTPKFIDFWQAPYLKQYVSTSFRLLLEDINQSQVTHFQRKEYKIQEDPWENYLFHDAKRLIHLICHDKPMQISHQVLLAKFIEYTVKNETISQYKLQGVQILFDLIEFQNGFELTGSKNAQSSEQVDEIIDSDDEDHSAATEKETLLDRIEQLLKLKDITPEQRVLIEQTEADFERMLRMFYLQMRVKNMLKEYKDDYFI